MIFAESFLFYLILKLKDKISSYFQNNIGEFFARSLYVLRQIRFFIIFLFIISLAITPDSQVQLSNLTSQKINLSQRQFGIVFVSLSNMLLLPLLLLLFSQKSLLRTVRITIHEVLMIFFVITSELSIISGIGSQASLVWLIKLIFSFSIYAIFSRLDISWKLIKVILLGTFFVILMQGLLAVAQFAKGGLIGVPIESTGRVTEILQNVQNPIQSKYYFRAVGTMSHPNNLSNFLAILFPLSAILFFLKGRFYKTFSLIGVSTCFIASILAFSRWGVITNLFSLFFLFFLFKKYTKFKIVNAYFIRICVVSIFFIFLTIIVSPFFENRFIKFTSTDKSLETRLELLDQSIQTIKDFPLLGVGGGAFLSYFINYDYTSSKLSQEFLAPVHNSYLLIASELGIIGLILFIAIMVSVAFFFYQRIKYLSGEKKLIAIGLFASFITFNFNGLMTLRTFEDRVGFLFCLLLGLLANLLTKKKTPTNNQAV